MLQKSAKKHVYPYQEYLFHEELADITKYQNIEREGYQQNEIRQDRHSVTIFPLLRRQGTCDSLKVRQREFTRGERQDNNLCSLH